MQNLPTAITFLQFSSITAYGNDGEEGKEAIIGDIAVQNLRKFASFPGADKHLDCGIIMVNLTLEQESKNKGNNNIVGDKAYASTTRLWELLVATTSDDEIFSTGDLDNYAEIMHSTNDLRRNNNKSETKPKANRSRKWKHILKPIWDEKDTYIGNGIPPSVPTIILPCYRIALVERLDILMASKAAGNTGIRNELVSVCDELLRQNLIDKQTYKIMMLQL